VPIVGGFVTVHCRFSVLVSIMEYVLAESTSTGGILERERDWGDQSILYVCFMCSVREVYK